MAMTQIEPVSLQHRAEAAKFLACGSKTGELADAAGEAVEALIDSRPPESVTLWRARSGERTCAAAMIIESPGRVGFLFHSAAETVGVDGESLTNLVRAISVNAIGEGKAFVQAALTLGQDADEKILRSVGFEFLAELIYMRTKLEQPVRQVSQDGLSWRRYGQFDDEQLAEVIQATYAGTLDCMLLRYVWPIEDVIAGHKGSGVFCPQSWWIVDCGGRPVGCVLANDATAGGSSEVIYMGVVEQFRGRGLGEVMLQRVAADAIDRGLTELTLAADSRNHYAMKIYVGHGFQETARRRMYALLGDRQVNQ